MNIIVVCPVCNLTIDLIATDEAGDDIRVLSMFPCEDCYFGDEDVYREKSDMPDDRYYPLARC